jgi:hypothetical protein
MKDADEFAPIALDIERVGLSLAIVGGREATSSDAKQGREEQALAALETFRSNGATYTEWREAFCAVTGAKKPTFDRARQRLQERGAIRQEGARYYAPLKAAAA